MRRSLFVSFAMLSSFCCGLFIEYIFDALPHKRKYEDMVALSVRTSLRTLDLIDKGESKKLMKEEESSIISSAMYISKHMQSHPGRAFWLWKIREYYKPKFDSLDDETKRLLESLPASDPGNDQRFHDR